MVHQAFVDLYHEQRVKFYSDNNKVYKNLLADRIKQLSIDDKSELIDIFQKQWKWKEYDYHVFTLLIAGNECGIEIAVDVPQVMYHLLLALGTKEFINATMELFKSLHHKLKLHQFMRHYFAMYGNTQPQISYYAYLLPAILKYYGTAGIETIINDLDCDPLHKLHAMRFIPRMMYANFISAHQNELDNEDLHSLLFELICRRREKSLEYTDNEINFIYYNLNHINAPAINYLCYFLSHISLAANRTGQVDVDFFRRLQVKAYALLQERDVQKVQRGAKIYCDFYKCVVRSSYKANYTITTKDQTGSVVYDALKTSGNLYISNEDDLPTILSFINADNFHLFGEMLDLHESERFQTLECLKRDAVVKFFNNLDDDYLENKIDVIIKLLHTGWYVGEEVQWIAEVLEDVRIIQRDGIVENKINYNLHREIKILKFLFNYVRDDDKNMIEASMMKIIDWIIDGKRLHTSGSKLFERIIVSAIDLLITSLTITNTTKTSINLILNYLEKGIFSNKRYTASATGILYRHFIANHFVDYKDILTTYVQSILANDAQFDQSASCMRRSLEKRTLVQEFCAAVPRSHQAHITRLICDACVAQMLITNNLNSDALKMYIFCLNSIMADTKFKSITFDYVPSLIEYCIERIDVFREDFSVCNAICTLFATLVQRLLPFKDHTKNMTVHDLMVLCPGLFCKQTKHSLFTRTRNMLFMSLLQRCDSEMPFALKHSTALQDVSYLWKRYTDANCTDRKTICTLEMEAAINLYATFTPIESITSEIDKIQTQMQCNGSMNDLNMKFKLLSCFCKRRNAMTFHWRLLQSLRQSMLQHSLCDLTYEKLQLVPLACLRPFSAKPLTIQETIKRICNPASDAFAKITAFEFCHEYFSREQFTKYFLRVYVEYLLNLPATSELPISALSTSLHTIISHIEVNDEVLQLHRLLLPPDSLVYKIMTNGHLEEYPNILAFLPIVLYKLRLSVDIEEKAAEEIARGYGQLASKLDSLQQQHAESLNVGFKYLRFILKQKDIGDLYLIALQFLHSEVVGQCDGFVAAILSGLNVHGYEGKCLNATEALRVLQSNQFLGSYFRGDKSLMLRTFSRYFEWRRLT